MYLAQYTIIVTFKLIRVGEGIGYEYYALG